MTLGIIGAGLYNTFSQSAANQANVSAQEEINSKNLAFQTSMNQLNRKWALEDWSRNAQYNSPLQQMQRLREAGLNPNLVYGNGAQNTAQMVTRTEAKAPTLVAPHVNPVEVPNIGGELAQYNAIKVQNQQVETQKAQQKLLEEQANATALTAAGKVVEIARSKFELGKAQALLDSTIEAAKLRVQGMQIQNTLAPLDYDLRAAVVRLQAAKTDVEVSNIIADTEKKRAETIAVGTSIQEVRARIDNLHREGKLQDFAVQLSNHGLTPHDPVYWRMFDEFINKIPRTDVNTTIDPSRLDSLRRSGYVAPSYHLKYKY